MTEKSPGEVRHPLAFVYDSCFHTPMPFRQAIFLLALAPALFAEIRPWKSADGLRSVQGEYLKHDAASVTLRAAGGKEVTIELTKLHPDERKWLDANHPAAAPAPGPVSDPVAVFDTLTFKDTRDTALAKLKASKIVVMTTDETFIGRSGLNGVFRTRHKIGNLSGFLYFDWAGDGGLKELNLQTEPRPDTSYKTELEPSWKEFIELLSTLYGTPAQKGPMPSMASLGDGSFSPSHYWPLENGGSALLGTAREGGKYQVVVRFTRSKPQVVEIP